jgi:NAD(P)-dependent dehydrogenase (short-subunit alcohol dehydrogenase family)
LTGSRVIIACRNIQASEIAVRKLREQILGCDIRLVHLDLASLRSVRKCAKELIDGGEKIHVLINNAGKLDFKNGKYQSV